MFRPLLGQHFSKCGVHRRITGEAQRKHYTDNDGSSVPPEFKSILPYRIIRSVRHTDTMHVSHESFQKVSCDKRFGRELALNLHKYKY